MKRGEIRWYKFKTPDKKRPVLILTRDSILEYLSEVTVAPVTTTVRQIPSEVFLSKSDSMPRDCAINFDHIQTVRIPEQIATPFRLKSPCCSDPNRHPIPEQIATPGNGK